MLTAVACWRDLVCCPRYLLHSFPISDVQLCYSLESAVYVCSAQSLLEKGPCRRTHRNGD